MKNGFSEIKNAKIIKSTANDYFPKILDLLSQFSQRSGNRSYRTKCYVQSRNRSLNTCTNSPFIANEFQRDKRKRIKLARDDTIIKMKRSKKKDNKTSLDALTD